MSAPESVAGDRTAAQHLAAGRPVDGAPSPVAEQAGHTVPGADGTRADAAEASVTADATVRPEPPLADGSGPPPDPDGPRKATRVADGAWLGGVCTGLARHLGWPVMVIRVGFVLLMITQFVGAIVYGALWLLMPADKLLSPEAGAQAPGLESHARTGLRSPTNRPRTKADIGAILALCAIGVGMIWLVQVVGLGVEWRIFWPVAFACGGAALLWRQADATQQKRWRSEVGGRTWMVPLVARGGWAALVRIVIGLGLVGAAVAMVVVLQGDLRLLPQVLAMTGLALGGLLIVIAPWVYRARQTLAQTREDKVRADARADMAAHLHDSVLQTLALIQRQSDDPKAVQKIARRQERELRGWLYGDEAAAGTLKAALSEAAADIEDDRGIPVELVVVGDCDVDAAQVALVRAAREAMLNAAKHSGAATIDVYAEVDEDRVEVFVRDRGSGFDVDAISEDRMGVRGSIIDRMERHGGRAVIRSTLAHTQGVRPDRAAGEDETVQAGTEVRLEMKR